MVWFEGAFFVKGLRLYRRLPDRDERALVLGLMASMVACLAHGLIDNSYFLVDLAFVFFITVGIVASMGAQNQMSLRGALRQAQDKLRDEAIPGGSIVDKQYYIYIMTNKRDTVLYTGVTNDLKRRVYEHKGKLVEGFTKKYKITKLVYYEVFDSIESAILREKQIKGGSRQKKIDLINSMNKEWRDLYEEL